MAIDLFAGCGGVTQGLVEADVRVLAAVECDSTAATAYRLNHPDVLLVEKDIREVDPLKLKREIGLRVGSLDLLTSCPPCQGFSSIRSRNGRYAVDDERNNLVYETTRFAQVFRPKVIMLENVPGLEQDYRFTELIARLRLLGYECESRVVNAAAYGVPQRRRRLVLLAARGRKPIFAQPSRQRVTVRCAIDGLAQSGKSGDPLHDIQEHRSKRISDLIALIPKNGGSRAALPEELVLACHRRFSGFRDVYGRMAWDDVAPTITGGCINPSKGRFLHPEENRAITLREAAILQGFPPHYDFGPVRSKHATALLIGNALPPPMIRAHARVVLARQQKGNSCDRSA